MKDKIEQIIEDVMALPDTDRCGACGFENHRHANVDRAKQAQAEIKRLKGE